MCVPTRLHSLPKREVLQLTAPRFYSPLNRRECEAGSQPSGGGVPSSEDVKGAMHIRYTEAEYLLQQQSQERAAWAASVRSATGNREHQFWEPSLDPPALLDGVVVVLVSPRRPISVGTVARAASCFEVGSLRIVQPRGEYVTRHSKSASKGAQYLLYRAREFDSVSDAVSDADLSIAFTRWVAGRSNAFFDLSAVLNHPVVQELICAPLLEDTNGNKSRARTRLALVFGREELGLSDAEVDACDAVCSIPIGRLQESLSLSHAVSIALSNIYSQRLAAVVDSTTAYKGDNSRHQDARRYLVRSVAELADGIGDLEGGTEQ